MEPVCTNVDADRAWRDTYRHAFRKASEAKASGRSLLALRRSFLDEFQAFDPMSAETVVSIVTRAFADVAAGREASSPFLTERG